MARAIHDLQINWLQYLESKFIELKSLELSASGVDPQLALETCFSIIPHLDPNAAMVQQRNCLYAILPHIDSREGEQAVCDRISRHELALGFSHKVLQLPCSPELEAEARKARQLHFQRYGGECKGVLRSRGATLAYYFSNNVHLLQGKCVLHVGPEEELKQWINGCKRLLVQYCTADPFMKDMDIFIDMSRMNLENNSFDMIICHRVLEHVYDDTTALAEAYRVLRPGGMLNISVPLAMDMSKSVDWFMPDSQRHGHLRMYGNDFTDLLRNAGFDVFEERWLFTRTHEELSRNSAYNMLMFNALKQ